jgi:hypothetical protein
MEKKDENKPLWQLTVSELKLIIAQLIEDKFALKECEKKPTTRVYGIQGLANLLHCSRTTANHIKRSGLIDDAITQINRKIVIDAELAIQLINNQSRRKGK